MSTKMTPKAKFKIGIFAARSAITLAGAVATTRVITGTVASSFPIASAFVSVTSAIGIHLMTEKAARAADYYAEKKYS